MNLSDIQLVVMEGRRVNGLLAAWIRERGFPNVIISHAPDGLLDHLTPWRNQVVKDFLAGPCKWLLMFDDDMVPVADTWPMVESEAGLVGCDYIGRNQHGDLAHTESNVGLGAVKISRRLLEAVPPPWFAFGYSPDGARVQFCECQHFCAKASAAGFPAIRAGRCAHIMPVAVLPGPKGQVEIRLGRFD
jgi:hypothetical protein